MPRSPSLELWLERRSRCPILSIEFCGVKAPNPFWLASGPPTNSEYQVRRAFDAGWGGAVWKTIAPRADRQRVVTLWRRRLRRAKGHGAQ